MLTSVRATHFWGTSAFYEARLSYSNRAFKIFDPEFGDDWMSYSDREKFAALGYDVSEWRSRYIGPAPYSVVFNFAMTPPGAPITFYTKSDQANIGGAIDFTSQFAKNWEIKFGAKI